MDMYPRWLELNNRHFHYASLVSRSLFGRVIATLRREETHPLGIASELNKVSDQLCLQVWKFCGHCKTQHNFVLSAFTLRFSVLHLFERILIF